MSRDAIDEVRGAAELLRARAAECLPRLGAYFRGMPAAALSDLGVTAELLPAEAAYLAGYQAVGADAEGDLVVAFDPGRGRILAVGIPAEGAPAAELDVTDYALALVGGREKPGLLRARAKQVDESREN